MYAIAVNKSQEFLLDVRRLLKNIFLTTTQGIRLRRRVDVFSTMSYTRPRWRYCQIVSSFIISLGYIPAQRKKDGSTQSKSLTLLELAVEKEFCSGVDIMLKVRFLCLMVIFFAIHTLKRCLHIPTCVTHMYEVHVNTVLTPIRPIAVICCVVVAALQETSPSLNADSVTAAFVRA